MPATITIPPNYWSQSVELELQLTDSEGNPYPAELLDNTGFIAGRFRFSVDAAGYTLIIPCNDEIPVPPTQAGSSTWTISVRVGRAQNYYRVAIHSASPPTDWNELIGAAEQVDADHIFTARLLPAGATTGQIAVKNAGDGWSAQDPPSGVGGHGTLSGLDQDDHLHYHTDARGDARYGPQLLPSGATEGQIAIKGPTDWEAQDPTFGVTDHGDLAGLGDDDHPHYHTDARGDARYAPIDHGLGGITALAGF